VQLTSRLLCLCVCVSVCVCVCVCVCVLRPPASPRSHESVRRSARPALSGEHACQRHLLLADYKRFRTSDRTSMLVTLRSVSHCPRLVAKTQTRDHALIYAGLVITDRSAAFRLACLMSNACNPCRVPHAVHDSGTALI
jgi:hypothetical protein